MEQSHSPSDVLSGLRENPSALMSARLSVKWSPASPALGGRWCWRGVDSSWQPGGWEESSGHRGGRSGFFLGHLKGRRGSRGAAAALIRHSDSAEWKKRKLSCAAHPVASPQVAEVRGATVTHSDSHVRHDFTKLRAIQVISKFEVLYSLFVAPGKTRRYDSM